MADKEFAVILGPHAVGKMTVGQELSKLTGLKLFHNHMSIELVKQVFDLSSTEGRYLNSLIRSEVFRLAAESDMKGLIFTYMFAFDEQSEYDYICGLIKQFKEHGAYCCVVELCADFDVRLQRNKTENRLLNKASKRDLQASEAEMIRTSKKYRLNSSKDDIIPFENYMKIDNTNLSPEEVAEIIKNKFNL